MESESPGDWPQDAPDPESTALLFDFDGTLVDIADRPDTISVPPSTRQTLTTLFGRFIGAVAVVSGRPVAELDNYLRIEGMPLAGVHGLELSDGNGHHTRHHFDQAAHGALIASAKAFAGAHTGLLVETKPGSVAVHYRRKPEIGDAVLAFARSLASATSGVELIAGKMVAELRLGGRSKADAVNAIMDLPAFAGRTPWFFGDDVTDEDAFRAANARGGRSFKIGSGETVANGRFAGIEAFHRWLRTLAGSESSNARAGRPVAQS